MIYCGKAEFGHISRYFASNSGAILLKRPKNLTQIGFPSLRSVKPDRLLEPNNRIQLSNFDLQASITTPLSGFLLVQMKKLSAACSTSIPKPSI